MYIMNDIAVDLQIDNINNYFIVYMVNMMVIRLIVHSKLNYSTYKLLYYLYYPVCLFGGRLILTMIKHQVTSVHKCTESTIIHI